MQFKSFKIKGLKWWILISAVILIKLFSTNRSWVEVIYSRGLYPYLAWFFRMLFGWIPISIGDLAYFALLVWLIWKFVKFIRSVYWKTLTKQRIKLALINGVFYLLVGYLIFNLAWGLNYNRQAAANQLDIAVIKYDSTQLKEFTYVLLEKVNESKQAWMAEDQPYPNSEGIFQRSKQVYDQSISTYPFLKFNTNSIKSSMYNMLGNYFGFTGYYNPFSGEAQVNTTVPPFIQPFTTAHEMAHQIGYAKENEASFVAYLAISTSNDQLFRYSCYLDMYMFARRELYFYDSTSAKELSKKLIPEVKADLEEWIAFSRRYEKPGGTDYTLGLWTLFKIK